MKKVIINNSYKKVVIDGREYIIGGDKLEDLESVLDGDDVIKLSGENNSNSTLKTLLNESF